MKKSLQILKLMESRAVLRGKIKSASKDIDSSLIIRPRPKKEI
jgi:hypothetical protein